MTREIYHLYANAAINQLFTGWSCVPASFHSLIRLTLCIHLVVNNGRNIEAFKLLRKSRKNRTSFAVGFTCRSNPPPRSTRNLIIGIQMASQGHTSDQQVAIGITSGLLVLTTFVVYIRLYIRCILKTGFPGCDDLTIFVAWVSLKLRTQRRCEIHAMVSY